MKLTPFKSLLLVAGIILSLVVTSCSKDQSELLSTVPSDAEWIQTLNLKKLLTEAGCTFSGDKVQLTPQLSKMLGNDAELEALISDMAGAIDMDHVVAFGAGRATAVCTFIITDQAAFTSCIESSKMSRGEGSGGYDLYTGSNRSALVVKGNQGWILQAASPIDKIKDICDNASHSSVMSLNGILTFLRGDNIANIAVAKTGMMLGSQTDVWTCINVNIKSNALAANIVNMEADGKIKPVENLQTINTDFLRYVPDNFTIAAAAGLTKGIDWESLATAATMAGGYRGRGIFDTLLPYLKEIDGTVAMATGAESADAWNNPSIANFGFIFMAHMPQATVDRALAAMAQFAGQAGIPVTTEQPSGLMTVNLNGVKLRAGNVDGYLTIANIPIESTHSNSLNSDFLSKQAALSFTIPNLSQFVRNADFGAKLTVGVEPENIHCQLNLLGTDAPILATLLSVIAQ